MIVWNSDDMNSYNLNVMLRVKILIWMAMLLKLCVKSFDILQYGYVFLEDKY